MGKMGKLYLLSSDEILAQLFYAKRLKLCCHQYQILFSWGWENLREFFSLLYYTNEYKPHISVSVLFPIGYSDNARSVKDAGLEISNT